MIDDSKGFCHGLCSRRKLRLLFSMHGLRSALLISFLFACMAYLMSLVNRDFPDASFHIPDDDLYKLFSGFCGFLIVFRAGNAVSRFSSGTEFSVAFTGQWFNAASSLFCFCRGSQANRDDVQNFQHTIVRLISLQVALAFSQLCGAESRVVFELIDVRGIDKGTLQIIQDSDCPVETTYQMIQGLVAASISNGVMAMPGPIVSRAFQEMGNAMNAFHESVKYAYFPMPYPYVVLAELFLLLHGWYSTLVIGVLWTTGPTQAFVWTFVILFAYRFLHEIAVELDNPFGHDANDIDCADVHFDMNKRLIALLQVQDAPNPTLSKEAVLDVDALCSQVSCAQLESVRLRSVITDFEDIIRDDIHGEQPQVDTATQVEGNPIQAQELKGLIAFKAKYSMCNFVGRNARPGLGATKHVRRTICGCKTTSRPSNSNETARNSQPLEEEARPDIEGAVPVQSAQV